MSKIENKNPKKRKVEGQEAEEEKKNEISQELEDEPFSFYSLLNIEKTASLEEIVFGIYKMNTKFFN